MVAEQIIEKIGWEFKMTEQPSDYVSRTSKEYALYVAQTRAIPRVTDGLKDGQRKALWMIRNKSDKIKTVALSGSLIAEELYVHGDASASETISALAAPYINNICFLDGIGAFGSKISPRAWGAPRYTYVKRNNVVQDILLADLDVTPLIDNYDGSNQSAETFLPLIPTVLLNGVSGVAVGWSTEILPHKFSDLTDSCISVLDNKKIKPLKPYYSQYNLDINHIENNSWTLNGKVEIIDHNTAKITELPPNMKIEKFKEFLDELEEKEKIQNYIDKSTEEIDIRVQFKRGLLKSVTTDQLVELFKIRTRVTERIVVLDWNGKSIKQYESPEPLIKDFVEWRLGWYKKRYERLLDDTAELLKFEDALKLCFDKKLPDKLSSFKNKQEVLDEVQKITKLSELSDKQIDKIVSMPSYRWTKESYTETLLEINRLTDFINSYLEILSDEQNIKNIYKDELQMIRKKYANF